MRCVTKTIVSESEIARIFRELRSSDWHWEFNGIKTRPNSDHSEEFYTRITVYANKKSDIPVIHQILKSK